MQLPASHDPIWKDTTAITGSLKDLGRVQVISVQKTALEPVWDRFMRTYHPLSYKTGARIKQLALIGGRVVAALGWGNSAKKLESRDAFIGWDPGKRTLLHSHVANNLRFLIPPWVEVPNLASHVLGQAVKQLEPQWKALTSYKLLAVETFVDPQKYRGTCYRAANWQHLGLTKGFSRDSDDFYRFHGEPKEIYFYVLDPHFRKRLNTQRRQITPKGFPNEEILQKWLKQMEALGLSGPLSVEQGNLDIPDLLPQLIEFLRTFAPCFARTSQMTYALGYLLALFSTQARRKNAENLAELVGQCPRKIQQFLRDYKWDSPQALALLRKHYLTTLLDEEEGCLAYDPSDTPKKGHDSVGVAPQYCGNLGKVANCQSGAFLSYVSPHGRALIDSRLYMPSSWFEPEFAEKRLACDVPSGLTYKSKADLGLEMIRDIQKEGVLKARWALADAAFGISQSFRMGIPEEMLYFLDIRENFHLTPLTGARKQGRLRLEIKPIAAEKLAALAAPEDWQIGNCESRSGRLGFCFLAQRVYLNEEEGEVWLFVRKNDDGKIKYAISNAPTEIPIEKLLRVSLMRWSIEECFRECKTMLGMGDYETRGWESWHRHHTLVIMAHAFLHRMTRDLQDRMPGLSIYQVQECMPEQRLVEPEKNWSQKFWHQLQKREKEIRKKLSVYAYRARKTTWRAAEASLRLGLKIIQVNFST